MRRLLVIPLLALLIAPGCKKDTPARDAGPAAAPVELVNRSVPGTPLELRIPSDWTIETVDPGPLPEPPTAPDGGPNADAPTAGEPVRIELRSRTMLSARAKKGARGESGRPWLMVLHDPFLPPGTTSTDYLEAQRASNQGVAQMEHVEAERSRRQGRPTYHVRDEWDVPVGDEKVRMSQEALLLLDADGEALHGYAVVLTLLEADRAGLEKTIDEMMASVRFADE